jgi:hypothetical protein
MPYPSENFNVIRIIVGYTWKSWLDSWFVLWLQVIRYRHWVGIGAPVLVVVAVTEIVGIDVMAAVDYAGIPDMVKK